MPRTIRFHLDENIDPAVAIGLQRRGVDVTSSVDVDLLGATDEQQMDYCIQVGRVIFTTDQDFLRRHAQDQNHPGIVFAHQHRTNIRGMIQGLMLIWEVLDPDDVRGRLEFVQ